MLVEREAELDALRAALADGAAGLSSVAVVEGVPGSGKTALIEAAVAEALAGGMAVVHAAGVTDPRWVRRHADGGRTPVPSDAVGGLGGRGL
ncbi:MAG: DUF2791 family P-loop domain-containing protein, partial [Streptomyces sp.]|nr:DUF2791 family P-loop domain-containing protein [Streptomyces sp.]